MDELTPERIALCKELHAELQNVIDRYFNERPDYEIISGAISAILRDTILGSGAKKDANMISVIAALFKSYEEIREKGGANRPTQAETRSSSEG